MNTNYGDPDLLPFDLRTRRITTYSVSTDAPEKAPARCGLAKTLQTAIRLALDNHDSMAQVEPHAVVQVLGQGDRDLFARFLQELPSAGSIRFIDQHNMAGFSFPGRSLDELERFHVTWDDAEHEFVDGELEALRSKLHELIGKYLGIIAENVFPAHSPGYLTVPPGWEERNPPKFFDVVSKLHESAAEVVAAHQDMVRIGRRRMDSL